MQIIEKCQIGRYPKTYVTNCFFISLICSTRAIFAVVVPGVLLYVL